MTKSISDIIVEVLESPDIQHKMKDTLDRMNNINPGEECMNCNKKCGRGHMLCADCYLLLKGI